jgi:hypothetical protein
MRRKFVFYQAFRVPLTLRALGRLEWGRDPRARRPIDVLMPKPIHDRQEPLTANDIELDQTRPRARFVLCQLGEQPFDVDGGRWERLRVKNAPVDLRGLSDRVAPVVDQQDQAHEQPEALVCETRGHRVLEHLGLERPNSPAHPRLRFWP